MRTPAREYGGTFAGNSAKHWPMRSEKKLYNLFMATSEYANAINGHGTRHLVTCMSHSTIIMIIIMREIL